jgi:PAS domain S-box-containing protein
LAFIRRHPFPARPSLAVWILAGSLLAGAGAWLGIHHTQTMQARHRFNMAVAESRDQLALRLRQSENLIRGVRGMAQAAGGVDQAGFGRYLQSMDLQARFPGLLRVTYMVPAPAGDRERLLARLRAEHGRPDLQVQPGWGFQEDSLVLYAEPAVGNEGSLGFNVASSPNDQAVVLAARDSGTALASGPVPLATGPRNSPGMVLHVAVYRGGTVPATLEQRRAAYSGTVNAVFLVRDLMSASFGRAGEDGVRLRLTDLHNPGRVFMTGGADRPAQAWDRFAPAGFTGVRELAFAGRTWRLEYRADSSFFLPGEVGLPWAGAAACLLIGSLLAGLFHSLSRTRLRAEELARRMTEKSRRNEARLQAILGVMPDVLLVYDQEGRYLEVLNQDVSRLWAGPEQMLGRRVEEVLPPEQAAMVHQTIQRVLRDQREHSVDYDLTTPRGTLRFEARVIPMEDGFTEQPSVLWAARDITEREGQESAQRQAQKLESLGVLAGGIAHDFNNLLTAIQGHLCLGRLAVAEQGDPVPHLDHMERSIRLAADLAHRLLAYSGRTAPEVQVLNLNVLLRDMITLLGVSRSKLVALAVDLEPELPPFRGDRVQIQQVIMNLVTNASEAIGERPGRVAMRTRLSRLDGERLDQRMPAQDLDPGTFVTLEVEDDGGGMADAVLARIFDPFFTTKQTGRGLGLSAMRGILRTHHAGIEIDSQLGKGTTIALHFPAMEAPAAAAPERLAEGPSGNHCFGTLLLAEDEPIIRDLSCQMAERLGFQVLAAEDGEVAWAIFQEHADDIRVAVLDLTMPRLGGAEVYALIRNGHPGLPILLCSGYSREAIPEALSPSEPRGFLQKPFTFVQFGAALRELMDK